MEGKQEAKKKYFSSIVSDNIRNFTAEMNKMELTKEDILSCFYSPSSGNYYAIIYV